MPARRSSFLRIEPLLLLLACPLLATDCGVRTVWGVPAEELQARLRNGDTAPLAHLDFARDRAGEAMGLEPGAPYYLSFLFESLGMKAQARAMLETAARECPPPWKEEAAAQLARAQAGSREWKNCAETARRFLKSHPESAGAEGVRAALVEALYWLGEDEAMLEEAARLAHPDAEVGLFRAVAFHRLKRDGARGLFLSLFLNERTAAEHGRAYGYLSAEKDFLQGFTDVEKTLFEAMNLLVQGDWNKGLPQMENAVTAMEPTRISGTALLWNLGTAYLYAGKTQRGQEVFQDLAARLQGSARLEALEFLGRLSRKSKDAVVSRKAFNALIAETTDGEQADRARWYLLDLAIQDGGTDMAAFLASESPLWRTPEDYGDLLEDYVASEAEAGRWKVFPALLRALEKSGPPRIRAQLAYIAARAMGSGLIPREAGLGLEIPYLFAAAEANDAGGYYGILAAVAQGRTPQLPGPVPDADAAQPGGSARKPGLDPLSRGYFSFGLASEAFRHVWALKDGLSADALAEAARLLAAGGEHRGSINAAGLLLRRGAMTGREAELLYPRAFAADIERLSASLGIPPRALFALVREESYFDEAVVSSAGAVGLAQLMPETAADAARKLRIADPDLKDPATSLVLGARHLQDLMARLPSLPKALLAYNAGLSRVRNWDARAGGLPSDLFVESVPFAESRGYVRKILVSAAMYAVLYDGITPREAVGGFYPELLRLSDSD